MAAPRFTIEDCRTIDDACQARMRVLDPTSEAYGRYRKLANKAQDMLVAMVDAQLDAELAADDSDEDQDDEEVTGST